MQAYELGNEGGVILEGGWLTTRTVLAAMTDYGKQDLPNDGPEQNILLGRVRELESVVKSSTFTGEVVISVEEARCAVSSLRHYERVWNPAVGAYAVKVSSLAAVSKSLWHRHVAKQIEHYLEMSDITVNTSVKGLADDL